MNSSNTLMQIYELLYKRFGPQHWWPGDGSFEIIVGAILTQNTNWVNVEKAIANLKSADSLNAEAIHKMEAAKLAQLIRPSGYYNIKARRLKNFLSWLFCNFDGDIEQLKAISTQALREQLLKIKGIGRETADSILLYAFGKLVFVVDAYTARVAVRHRLIEPDADYEQLRELFESNLAADERLFNEYHALLVRVGKKFCRPKPQCKDCPLEPLPHDIEIEDF